MTKEQREKLALERREAEIQEGKQKLAEQRRLRLQFLEEARESLRSGRVRERDRELRDRDIREKR